MNSERLEIEVFETTEGWNRLGRASSIQDFEMCVQICLNPGEKANDQS
ncbi:MAG: hypothetical protein JJU37_12735 [Balneolaceae bacterium]|nr:hypothetical protein [Balneolaceae bacterium]